MASIYELTGKYKLLETAIALNPEVDELKEELAKIDDAIEVKAENYGKLIRNLESDVMAIDSELKRLQTVKMHKTNAVNRLKDNLKNSMKETGKTKFKTELFSFTVAGNGGVEPLVLDVVPTDLPKELQKVTIEADNNKIREYIKETGDFSYAHFGERGDSLRIK